MSSKFPDLAEKEQGIEVALATIHCALAAGVLVPLFKKRGASSINTLKTTILQYIDYTHSQAPQDEAYYKESLKFLSAIIEGVDNLPFGQGRKIVQEVFADNGYEHIREYAAQIEQTLGIESGGNLVARSRRKGHRR